MLNLTEGVCCVTIDNATTAEEARKMRKIAAQTGELFQAMQPRNWFEGSWITSLLKSLRLTGWGKWLVNVALTILCGFLFLTLGLVVAKCMISCLLSSFCSAILICYVQITTVKESLGVFEPQSGVRNKSKVIVL